MHLTHLLPLLAFTRQAIAAVLNERATCNADNCLRAVRASSASGRVADCSNYLVTITTLSGAPTKATPTVTTTIYSIYGEPLETPTTTATPAPVTPGTIPAYAAACSGTARFSSACSCLGVASTVVTVSTVTPPAVTSTNIITACRPANNYGHRYDSGSYTPPSGTTDGFYNFPGNAQQCCAACFREPGCMIYKAVAGTCYLTFYQGGVVKNPFNGICKAGIATGDFVSGTSLGRGPCLRL